MATRWTSVSVLTQNSGVFLCVVQVLKYTERKTGQNMKIPQSEVEGEYFYNEFSLFYEKWDILSQQTCAYSPLQNRIAERINRRLLNTVWSKLKCRNVHEFWADEVVIASYIRNRLTRQGITTNTTPFEIKHGCKPNLSPVCVFRSKS